jgi:hypothetical protein
MTKQQAEPVAKLQSDTESKLRNESTLDPSIPLGLASGGWPISGPTVQQYFADNFKRGEYGRFWLHQLSNSW